MQNSPRFGCARASGKHLKSARTWRDAWRIRHKNANNPIYIYVRGGRAARSANPGRRRDLSGLISPLCVMYRRGAILPPPAFSGPALSHNQRDTDPVSREISAAKLCGAGCSAGSRAPTPRREWGGRTGESCCCPSF